MICIAGGKTIAAQQQQIVSFISEGKQLLVCDSWSVRLTDWGFCWGFRKGWGRGTIEVERKVSQNHHTTASDVDFANIAMKHNVFSNSNTWSLLAIIQLSSHREDNFLVGENVLNSAPWDNFASPSVHRGSNWKTTTNKYVLASS